jgi:hypothetical protein
MKLFVIAIIVLLVILCWPKNGRTMTERRPWNMTIPKVIWSFWHDAEDMPEIVKTCMKSWTVHNPGYRINIVTRNTVKDFLPDIDASKWTHADGLAHFADRVRINLLVRYGGIWIDASILCTRPLQWIHDLREKHDSDVVAFYIDGFTTDKRYPVIENWFIASIEGSPVILEWKREMDRVDTLATLGEYIEDVKRQGVNLQKIDALEYLHMHVAAQYVFQKKFDLKDLHSRIHLLEAEKGPFKYLATNNWDQERSFEYLCKRRDAKTPLVKFRGTERAYAIANPHRDCTKDLI